MNYDAVRLAFDFDHSRAMCVPSFVLRKGSDCFGSEMGIHGTESSLHVDRARSLMDLERAYA